MTALDVDEYDSFSEADFDYISISPSHRIFFAVPPNFTSVSNLSNPPVFAAANVSAQIASTSDLHKTLRLKTITNVLTKPLDASRNLFIKFTANCLTTYG